jgi:hypothetical protein
MTDAENDVGNSPFPQLQKQILEEGLAVHDCHRLTAIAQHGAQPSAEAPGEDDGLHGIDSHPRPLTWRAHC